MAYNKSIWINEVTSANEDRMMNIENGIERAHDLVEGLAQTVDEKTKVEPSVVPGNILIDEQETPVYRHPNSHSADIITETATKKFVTPEQIEEWDNKMAPGSIASTVEDGLMSKDDKAKLDGIQLAANNYVHPEEHDASIITEDETHRFATDAEKTTWNAKASADHNHDSSYSPVEHAHTEYSATSHTHTEYALTEHTHEGVGTHTHSASDINTDATRRFVTDQQVSAWDTMAAGGSIVDESSINGNVVVNQQEIVVYEHPQTHPATVVVEDETHRFVSDTEKTTWSAKASSDHNHNSQYAGLAHAHSEYLALSNIQDGNTLQLLLDPEFQISNSQMLGTEITSTTTGYALFDIWKQVVNKDGATFPTVKQSYRKSEGVGDGAGWIEPELPFGSTYYRINTSSAGSNYGANSSFYLCQYIENAVRNICRLNRKLTVSFYARSTIANKKIGIKLMQNYGTGGTSVSPEEIIAGNNFTLTSTWQRFSHTFTANTINNKVFGTNNDDALVLAFQPIWGSSIAAQVGSSEIETFKGAGNIEISGAMLSVGDQLYPYLHKNISNDRKLIKRYIELPSILFNNVTAPSGTIQMFPIIYETEKRIIPTISVTNLVPGSGTIQARADSKNGCGIIWTSTYNGTDNMIAFSLKVDARM